MKNIALTIPGAAEPLPTPAGLKPEFSSLGGIASSAINLAILIASILMFFWMIWGIFQYIYAGGDKEALGKARSRITLALVGFFIVVIALAISQFAKTIIPSREHQPVQEVTEPTPPNP